MTSDKNWHISKGINLSFFFALILQLAAAVWFFSAMSERVTNIEETLVSQKEEFAKENLRQWERINDNEELSKRILSQTNTTAAILERLEQDLRELRDDMKDTNNLLREYLSETKKQDI